MRFTNKNKEREISVEAEAEHIIEKAMDLHEKNWKEKFTIKHKAKKEMLKLKHNLKNDMKLKEMQEGEKTRELEREDTLRKEEEYQKMQIAQVTISILLAIIGSAIIALGCALGKASDNEESGWYALSLIGIAMLVCIKFVWKINK